ncbi:MAG: alpha/beta fold hydrolase [Caldilineaceae bacterium]
MTAHVQSLSPEQPATEPTTLLRLQPNGIGAPLICLPGAGGSPLYLHTLAQAMGSERPFYVMEALGLDGKTPPHTTVAAAAAYQIEQLQRQLPELGSSTQPYYLAGHSFGGYVAYEMAQQLHKAGATIGGVIIFDTGAPTGEASPMEEVDLILLYERLFLEEYGLAPTLTADQLTPLTTEARLLAFKASLERGGVFPANSPLDPIRGIVTTAAADLRAGDYLPTDFAMLPIHLFVATAEDDGQPCCTETKQKMIDGWSRFGAMTVHEVPGSHTTLMYQPHVAVLAAQLRAAIAARAS